MLNFLTVRKRSPVSEQRCMNRALYSVHIYSYCFSISLILAATACESVKLPHSHCLHNTSFPQVGYSILLHTGQSQASHWVGGVLAYEQLSVHKGQFRSVCKCQLLLHTQYKHDCHVMYNLMMETCKAPCNLLHMYDLVMCSILTAIFKSHGKVWTSAPTFVCGCGQQVMWLLAKMAIHRQQQIVTAYMQNLPSDS